jgi:PAS domain S-box-containing protein
MNDIGFDRFETSLNEFPVILMALSENHEVVYANELANSVIEFAKNSRNETDSLLSLLFPNKRQQESLSDYFDNPPLEIVDLPEAKIVNKKGSVLLINWKIRYRNSEIFPGLKYWLIGQDSTQNFLMKKQLFESEEKFNFISKTTNDAIYDWDLINDVLKWSDGITNIFGHDETKIENNIDWWKLHVHPDDSLRIDISLNNALASSENFWIENYRFLLKDGTYAFVKDKGYFVRDNNGKATRMVGGMQDVSDIKRIEQKLLEKNRKLSEIAFFNSHKLRAPLARILGLVSTLDPEEENLSGTVRDIINKLNDSTKELDQMVKEMGKLTNI